jgi:RNA recognition motif-containing protein
MKKDPKNPRQLISLGYGFIQFKKRADSEKALKTLQHSVLNEHAIELKRSNRTVKYVYPQNCDLSYILCTEYVNNNDDIVFTFLSVSSGKLLGWL